MSVYMNADEFVFLPGKSPQTRARRVPRLFKFIVHLMATANNSLHRYIWHINLSALKR